MEQTHYIIVLLIFIVFMYLCFYHKLDRSDNVETMIDSTNAPANLAPPSNVNLDINIERYLPEYPYIFRNYPWYNALTPLPFYNPTRFSYSYPFYPYIQNYYYPRVRYY